MEDNAHWNAERYGSEGTSDNTRDEIADEWGDIIYFCVDCDEECWDRENYVKCPRFPREHDETGYMGTGTDYPESIRRLAGLIARDD